MASEEVKILYDKCNKRTVAVENLESNHKKIEYAEEVITQINAMDGLSNQHFNSRQERKQLANQELEKALKKPNRSSCTIH